MKYLLALLFSFLILATAGDKTLLKIGEKAPMFKLKNYDKKEYDLTKVMPENKFTVIMFVSTECPVSNAYNGRMLNLFTTYSVQGVGFLGVNANKAETMQDIRKHAREKGFKFPVLKDELNKVADLYSAQVTPETFVLDSYGKLVYHGRIDDNRDLEKVEVNDLGLALDALLMKTTPPKTEAKAFGCSIKRVTP